MNKKYVLGMLTLAAVATLVTAIPAFAQSNQPANGTNVPSGMQRSGGPRQGMMKPGVFGTVSAVSGNTITVLGRSGFGKTMTATTTYTVDATNAKVTKSNTTSTVASIAVGDNVAVQGTITGTNVVATMIRDGIMGRRAGVFGAGRGNGNKPATSTQPIITGNGEPVIAGTISTISGSSITITNKSNVTYNVDATNAKITQGNTASDVSTLKVGDTVVIQGTVNSSSIIASSVIDQIKPSHPGFLGGIGKFFMHLFGF